MDESRRDISSLRPVELAFCAKAAARPGPPAPRPVPLAAAGVLAMPVIAPLACRNTPRASLIAIQKIASAAATLYSCATNDAKPPLPPVAPPSSINAAPVANTADHNNGNAKIAVAAISHADSNRRPIPVTDRPSTSPPRT